MNEIQYIDSGLIDQINLGMKIFAVQMINYFLFFIFETKDVK